MLKAAREALCKGNDRDTVCIILSNIFVWYFILYIIYIYIYNDIKYIIYYSIGYFRYMSFWVQISINKL